MRWREHPLDSALLRFDPESGTNVLLRGPETTHLHRAAHRSLQIGLLTPCNLACTFCYRDARAPSRLTASFTVLMAMTAARRPWLLLALVISGCGESDRPSPPPRMPSTPSRPAIAPSAPAEPSAGPRAPEPRERSLAALLPAAEAPISLAHARSLAREGAWPAAAAVYDALFAADPTDARALAGRGFALMSWGDARAAGPARADLERALEISEDRALLASVHFNLATLDEREGHPDAALAHFRQALELRHSRAARDAIVRLGGSAPRPARPGVVCELSEAASAQEARDLRAAVAAIVRAQGDDYSARGAEPPAPESEPGALELLCPDGCDARAPFLSDLAVSEDSVEAHLVAPREAGGYWVIPRIDWGNGPNARCPDQIHPGEITPGPIVRARLTYLANFWDECDMEDPDCLNGCFWESRVDRDVLLSSASGRFVTLAGARRLGYSVDEGSSAYPASFVRLEAAAVRVQGCGIDRRVEL